VSASTHGFSVPFAFPVSFVRGAWHPESEHLNETIRRMEPDRCHRVLVVADEQVVLAQPALAASIAGYFAVHSASMQMVAPLVVVPGGEAVKNDLAHTFSILQRINEVGLDRQSFVLVIGGGAVLDMVSFAAAIAHRGIRVIRMPTTVLAQADSGIAVKNSVNLFGKKNFIGTFVPPFAVINDTDTLATLPHRDKIAGVSEAVKVALLRSPMFYRYLELHVRALAEGDSDVLGTIVRRSAELHLAHICGNGDPFELGSARPLDFGHWSAHKLESMTSHRIRHGEAVAMGMALDLTYAVLRGFLDRRTKDDILHLLETIGFSLWDDAMGEREADGRYTLLRGLTEFREHLGGQLHITMLRDIGSSFEVTEMDEVVVARSIEQLCRRAVHARAGFRQAAAAVR
jgi:3-dehydroquinate synthase